MDSVNGIWITWEIQRRNWGISSALGFPLHEIIVKGTRIKRYLFSIIKTYKVISISRPSVVVAQNPSIVLACTVIFFRKLFDYKVVIDAHNSGIYPCEGNAPFLLFLSSWLQKNSDLILVTNSILKEVVIGNDGFAMLLPDKIPICPQVKKISLLGAMNIVFICTFSDDEPYDKVIEAASLLPERINLYFTGKYVTKINPSFVPRNVVLTGFLPEDDYWSLLKSADIIMDLTLREGCLVCGAYEALAVGTPLILSNTSASRKYFNKGCIYVDPTPQSISEGIVLAMNRLDQLKCDIQNLKSELESNWKNDFNALSSFINGWI